MLQLQKFLDKFAGSVYRTLASTKFFIFSVGLFLVHTVWLALSAHSLPFDEYYHLGIIKFYSHQWSPIITSQPVDMSFVGDMTRLPSYLYHYLMSFPYRLFEALFSNDYWVVVSMRFINIAIVIAGVILFRKLMLKVGLSRRLTHLSLFIFMLLPIISLLAAESNYDNLMFLLTPIFINFAYELYKRKFTYKNIVGFISVACLAILVKNEFIVFAGLTFIYLVLSLWWSRPHNIIGRIKKDIRDHSIPYVVMLSIILFATAGLFVERYGVNLVQYRQINVQCEKVQLTEYCKQYSPWRRNYDARQSPLNEPQHGGALGFSQHWVHTIVRGFVATFANVPIRASADDPYGHYEFSPLLAQMIIPSYIAMVTLALGIVFYAKKWWRVGWLRATISIFIMYALVLWMFNFQSYLELGRAYAIQSRYLLPLMIPVIASVLYFAGLMIRHRVTRASLAAIVVILFVYSGGIFGWVIRSNPGWYWQSDRIIRVNQDLQSALQKVIYNTRLPKV